MFINNNLGRFKAQLYLNLPPAVNNLHFAHWVHVWVSDDFQNSDNFSTNLSNVNSICFLKAGSKFLNTLMTWALFSPWIASMKESGVRTRLHDIPSNFSLFLVRLQRGKLPGWQGQRPSLEAYATTWRNNLTMSPIQNIHLHLLSIFYWTRAKKTESHDTNQ